LKVGVSEGFDGSVQVYVRGLAEHSVRVIFGWKDANTRIGYINYIQVDFSEIKLKNQLKAQLWM
jgi:hypothetical protein